MESLPLPPDSRTKRCERTAPRASDVERATARLIRAMHGTIAEHGLVEEGDRILVAVSGGKDSYTMLDLLCRARRVAPISFDLVAFHLDQAQPGYDGTALREWLTGLGNPFEIVRRDTYTAVIEDATTTGSTYCRLCSRLRRSILYEHAAQPGCNKIALGHHRDDANETLLLNLFYAGRLQAMPATYRTNEGSFDVIRPLIECAERDIEVHAVAAGYPIVPCNLCGSQENLKRESVKRLLDTLEREIPDVRQVMLAAIKNVRPSHLLDREVAEAWNAAAGRYPERR